MRLKGGCGCQRGLEKASPSPRIVRVMQFKSLTPLMKLSAPLPRVYFLYGSEDTLPIIFDLLKAFLSFRNPSFHFSVLESVDQLPAPDLFGGTSPLPSLYHVGKAPKDLAFLEASQQDIFLFSLSRFTQKMPLFQAHKLDKRVAFVACYEASFQDVKEFFSLRGLSVDPEALEFLASTFRLFPKSVVGLLDKLPFLSGPLTKQKVQNLLPEEEESRYHLLVDAFFGPAAFFRERLRVTPLEESDFIPFSRLFIAACQKLHQLLLSVHRGAPLRSALYDLRFPLFFNKQAFFTRALRKDRWETMRMLYLSFLQLEKDLMTGHYQKSAVARLLDEAHGQLFSESPMPER